MTYAQVHRLPLSQKHPHVGLDADDSAADREEVAAFDAGAEPALDRDDAGQNGLVQPEIQFGLLRLAQEDLLVTDLVVLRIQVHSAQEFLHVVLRTNINSKLKF